MFDLSLLVLAHFLLFPLWILLWTIIPLIIWIGDRKSVFFQQKRMGKDGKPFNVIKFRTMVIDAENQGPAWTSENDPRVTRVGRILRRTALDELPGVISIWKGHMSFVGPRALDLDEYNSLKSLMPGFENRLQVQPGLTGLAQIYNIEDDPYEKYKYDMEYIQKLSPILDIRLILLSIWNTLVGQWDNRSGKVILEETQITQVDLINDQQAPIESEIKRIDNHEL